MSCGNSEMQQDVINVVEYDQICLADELVNLSSPTATSYNITPLMISPNTSRNLLGSPASVCWQPYTERSCKYPAY